LIVSPLIAALPFWFRLLQCARRFYDTGPFLHNGNRLGLVGHVKTEDANYYHFVIKDVNWKFEYRCGGCSSSTLEAP